LQDKIARAITIFQVDEIVVFNAGASLNNTKNSDGRGATKDPNVFLARILQYIETPQYLRKALFPFHRDFSCCGLLNPLDAPHHVRVTEETLFREGVVTERGKKEKENEMESGSFVDVGLPKEVQIDRRLMSGVRVTVEMEMEGKHYPKKKKC